MEPHRAGSRQQGGDAGRAAAGDRRSRSARQPADRRVRGDRGDLPERPSLAWTRKRVGMPIEGTIEVPGRRWQLSGRGVDDESAGHHKRETSWRWSAGVGPPPTAAPSPGTWSRGSTTRRAQRARDLGRRKAGRAAPGPVAAGRDRPRRRRVTEFSGESEHTHDDNYILIRSHYRHRFGSFSGALGGVELGYGLGVMEEHDALW